MLEKNINKRELSLLLSKDHKITIMLAENIIEKILEFVRDGVNKGHKVSLGGFGIFRKKVRVARMCRNPRTGKEVMVGDVNIVKFTPATSFKELIK